MSDNEPLRPVGVIGLPSIGKALTTLGFDVIGGGDEIGPDVAAVRTGLEARQFAVLIGNPATPAGGLLGIVNTIAPKHPVALIDLGGPGPLVHPKALRVESPATLGDLVAIVNRTLSADKRVAPPEQSLAAVIESDGTVTPVGPAADDDTEDVSPWDLFDNDDETEPVEPAVEIATPVVIHTEPEPEPEPAPQPPPVPDPTAAARPLPEWMDALPATPPAATPPPAPVAVEPPVAPPAPDPLPTPVPVAPTQPVTQPQPVPVFAPVEPQPMPAPVAQPAVIPTKPASVIVCTAAKGGAAKTTTARLLAQCAGAAGLRVVLIDANGGQDGQRKMMRLTDDLPSAYDYAVGNATLRDIIITPETANTIRPDALDNVLFATILAPPAAVADHSVVTPQVYADITHQAAAVADLVIVDTQMVEAPSMRDRDSFALAYMLPVLRDNPHHYLLTLFDNNKEAYENLIGAGDTPGVLDGFVRLGVDPAQVLILATLVAEGIEFDDAQFAAATQTLGRFVGHTNASSSMSGRINAGSIDHDDPSTATALNAVLRAVTQLAAFDITTAPPERRGLFRRGRR